MRVKAAVTIEHLTPQMALGATIVNSVYESLGYECIVTSGNDGEHSPNSKHYEGNALDFRTRHVPNAERPALAEALSGALGENFDVVVHSTHIHVEYDPK